MVYRNRSELVQHTDIVRLKTQFRGPDGQPADLDSFPTITITQPSGNVMVGPTSAGVARIGVGLYEFDLPIGINESIGGYVDTWNGTLDGFILQNSHQFYVADTQLPTVNSDGYVALGDDPGFNYSQGAIRNINKLLKALRARLNSSGKSKAKDKFGNVIYVDCDIFSVDVLVTHLADSLALLNSIPHFTSITFDHDYYIDLFFHQIVQGATIFALASKALIERGREFNISDNGISYTPPTVSELLNSQYGTEIANHTETLKLIKSSLKPFPSGLGSLTTSSARVPFISSQRHRRAGRIY